MWYSVVAMSVCGAGCAEAYGQDNILVNDLLMPGMLVVIAG